jgi:hypothetical protein
VATGGSVPTTTPLDPFWTQGYDVTQLPQPASGWHHPGKSCMTSGCHDGSNPTASKFLFAGTVYAEGGLAAAVGAEVGISDGTSSYFVYTAHNGNFWLPVAAQTVDFAKADIRILNAKGQLSKLAADSRGADCNTCHSDASGSEASLMVVP